MQKLARAVFVSSALLGIGVAAGADERTIREEDRTDAHDSSWESYVRRLESVGRIPSNANARLEAINAGWMQPQTGGNATFEAALEAIDAETAETPRLVLEIEAKLRGVRDHPGGGFRTLQEALDAVPDGGTLRLAAGTYPVDTPLYVRGKSVFVRGPGRIGPETARLVAPRPDRVVPARDAVGVFNLIDAGGGLIGFEITGGDVAAVMRGTANRPLAVMNMKMAHNGRAILHLAPSDLSVKDSMILHSLWNGISFAPKNVPLGFLPNLVVEDSEVFSFSGQNMGIFVSHASLWKHGVALGGWTGGGIGLEASSAIIDDPYLIQNGTAGILMWGGSQASITDATIQNTVAHGSGTLGDGISVWCSEVPALAFSEISGSARASMSIFGGEASIGHTTMSCSGIDIAAENIEWGTANHVCAPAGLHPAIVDDLGNNQCGCPSQGVPMSNCKAQAFELVPPPPVGGLE